MNSGEPPEMVTVVADEHGVIVATVHRAGQPSGEAPTNMEVQPQAGQRVHTVRVPPELARLGPHERIDRLHEDYRLGPDGTLRRRDGRHAATSANASAPSSPTSTSGALIGIQKQASRS